MFWGLNLKPNRKYSQTTEKSFHISQAALDSESSQGGPTQIWISSENQRFLICTLRKEVCEQVMLDLNFAAGNEICFQSIGNGNVALSGYVIEDDMSDDFMNGDEEEDEEVDSDDEEVEQDLRQALNAKKAQKNKKAEKAKPKAVAANEEEDDDDEDDSDFDAENPGAEDDDAEDDDEDDDEDEDDDDDDDDDDEEEDEDESEDEEVQQPKAKQPKLDKPEKQQNGVAKQKEQPPTEKKSKKEKKEQKQKEQQQQQQQQQNKQDKQQKAGGERSLSGGVKVVDIRVGNGPEAKPGKSSQVYYEGRLLSNNKVFDSVKTGAGFKFRLGRGEVIKGLDVGVVGMKVGGKRRITCPPHMAYGSRGSPPTIPPNSTLVFEVELRGVN
uniref:FK506-binding protein n=1 Tax=Stomoxys calcitrans TaxID=35570 RepID=A0A1I8PI51_STOCA